MTRLSVKKPFLVVVAVIIILVTGFVAMTRMPRKMKTMLNSEVTKSTRLVSR